MGKIIVNECPIEGLYVIEPTVLEDDRGYFYEVYNSNDMKEAGIDRKFVQINQNFSVKGALRGLHFQKKYPQCKLSRVIQGSVFDVAVDIRENSDTYGKWYGVVLSEENKKQFLIPEGFAHGMLALTETAIFCYQCTDFYHPGDEGGIAWNDPDVGIEWPDIIGDYPGSPDCRPYSMVDGSKVLLSEKDQRWARLKDTFR